MQALANLASGFAAVLEIKALLFCMIGVVVGAFVGALPGLGPSAGTAILLPFIFGMSPKYALIMLCGIYYGTMYSGSITAILLNIPGTSGAIFAATEGHPLYLQGKGAYAVRTGIVASFLAGTICTLLLTFFAPAMAAFCLKFGAVERFALMFFAFVFVCCLSGKTITKNFIAMGIGILLSMIGVDRSTGFSRFTFGQVWLIDGVDFTIAILGCFAIAEIMKQAGMGHDPNMDQKVKRMSLRDVVPRLNEINDLKFPMLRGGVIGFICGAMPGAGAAIATFISYGVEKKLSKQPEKFGHGAIEGIACTEAANNASSAGAMIPLLGLGIPGSSTTAVLLTGFMMFGLQPGPLLFTNHPDVAWPMIASMYIGNIMLVVGCLAGVSVFIWLVQKSIPFLTPLVVVVCAAGAMAINNWTRDLWFMVAFGLAAYVLSVLDFPLTNLLLGLILGQDTEFNFLKSILLADGDFTTFFKKPISLVLMLVSIAVIVWPLLKWLFVKVRPGKQSEADS